MNNNSLEVWNSGLLPEELKTEMLFNQHASIPRNRSLANLFFRAGYIESWGRGTITIAQECKEYGLPLPSFNEQFGGFSIGFYKPEFTTPPDTPPVTPPVTPPDTLQLTPQVKQLIAALKGAMTRAELQTVLRISNKKYFLTDFIKPALEVGSIEMTIPDKPNSKNQKYRLTNK